VSLATPDMIRLLQEALGIKAKQASAYRFYVLDDKVLGRTSGLMPTPLRNNPTSLRHGRRDVWGHPGSWAGAIDSSSQSQPTHDHKR